MSIDSIKAKNRKTIVIDGTVTDYAIETIGLTEGIGFSSEYTIKKGKIISIEFQRDKEDEAIINEKTAGIVGFYLDLEGDQMKVTECDEGLPAKEAGIKTGDIIEAVDGIDISEMKYGMKEAIYRIRGPVGTEVELKIRRQDEVFTVKLKRVKI